MRYISGIPRPVRLFPTFLPTFVNAQRRGDVSNAGDAFRKVNEFDGTLAAQKTPGANEAFFHSVLLVDVQNPSRCALHELQIGPC